MDGSFSGHYLSVFYVYIQVFSVDTVAMDKGSRTASGTDFKGDFKL